MDQRHDLIVFSHLRWRFVWQRPQHLISRLARGRRTLFIEEPALCDVDEPRLQLVDEGAVTRVVYELPGDGGALPFTHDTAKVYLPFLEEFLTDTQLPPVAWLYTPMALELARACDPALLVYDVMDDLSSFKDAPEDLLDLEEAALAEADLVFAGGRSLYERASRFDADRALLFPSGVDPDHYAAAREGRTVKPRPAAGYVGVIDERLDLDLVAGVAARLADWDIQMVGPVVKVDPGALPQAANLHYLGGQPYSRLPEVMRGFDVALMPFAINDATRSISPTKTLEYLAAGLPVVSTRIRDVVTDYASVVALEEDADGFARACREVLRHDGAHRDAKAKPLIRLHNWDSIARRMRDLMDDALQAKRSPVTRLAGGTARRGFDVLIVGAGFAGSVLAERLAGDSDKKVLVVDKRPHIGGNAYDHYDEHGILVHKYGPHIFHTNSREVFDYLSRFTKWRQYEHRVLASVDGRLVPIPINLDTVNELYGLKLTAMELEAFFISMAEPVPHPKTSEDVVVGKVGRDLYEKLFRNYTRKQWGLDPSELDATVTARVPTRTNRDDRYFTDVYQAMPLHGYTKMFERMLDHPNINIMLNSDYREIEDMIPYREMVYTGPVDEFFDYRYGRLPYRSLEFRFETRDLDVAQPAPVVNYPNEHPYTRSTEFKYLTGQRHEKTTLVYEYPQAEGDPYYPVPRPENAELYKRYKALADATEGVHFVGRLATYKYYNMDQVTAQALAVYKRIARTPGASAVLSQPGAARASEAALRR